MTEQIASVLGGSSYSAFSIMFAAHPPLPAPVPFAKPIRPNIATIPLCAPYETFCISNWNRCSHSLPWQPVRVCTGFTRPLTGGWIAAPLDFCMQRKERLGPGMCLLSVLRWAVFHRGPSRFLGNLSMTCANSGLAAEAAVCQWGWRSSERLLP